MLKKERYIESNKRVEAAGVEPASDNKRRKASTRVVCLFFSSIMIRQTGALQTKPVKIRQVFQAPIWLSYQKRRSNRPRYERIYGTAAKIRRLRRSYIRHLLFSLNFNDFEGTSARSFSSPNTVETCFAPKLIFGVLKNPKNIIDVICFIF